MPTIKREKLIYWIHQRLDFPTMKRINNAVKEMKLKRCDVIRILLDEALKARGL